MVPGFHENAIILSGETGSKLKSKILSVYYELWWRITSGGQREHLFPTTIVDLNAATGEIYIQKTGETILGSASHAVVIKTKPGYRTEDLQLVLVEEDSGCFQRLRNVMRLRFGIDIELADATSRKIHAWNVGLDEALDRISSLKLGNALFLFDPLRYVKWGALEKVTGGRIRRPFQTATEFIVFLFTSDWIRGRRLFTPLPTTADNSAWSSEEKGTVSEADDCFGNTQWRALLLRDDVDNSTREQSLLSLYVRQLHRWFRHVLPLPFTPEKEELYHLICCSNYPDGIRALRNAHQQLTDSRDETERPADLAFARFRKLHPGLCNLGGKQRPLVWKMLWKIISTDKDGIYDAEYKWGFEAPDDESVKALTWLTQEGYLTRYEPDVWSWSESQNRILYRLNQDGVVRELGVNLSRYNLRPLPPS